MDLLKEKNETSQMFDGHENSPERRKREMKMKNMSVKRNQKTNENIKLTSTEMNTEEGTATTSNTSIVSRMAASDEMPPPICNCLKLNLQSRTVSPKLRVDKRLGVNGRHGLHFKVWSTSPSDDIKYTREITLTNTMNTNLIFTLNVTKPFSIVSIISEAITHPLSKRSMFIHYPENEGTLHSIDSSSSSILGNTCVDDKEKIFVLPTGKNIILTIRYDRKLNILSDSTFGTSIIKMKNITHGLLSIVYANGDQQEIDLKGEIFIY